MNFGNNLFLINLTLTNIIEKNLNIVRKEPYILKIIKVFITNLRFFGKTGV